MLSLSSMLGRGPSTISGREMSVRVLESSIGCGDANLRAGIATLGTSKGLLELYHIPADFSTPYASGNDYATPGAGFGHIGFTVPDVTEALTRVKSFGFEVIKPLNEAKEEQMGLPDKVVQGDYGHVSELYKHVFKQLAFVKDPDVSACSIGRRGD
jgi:catechol 2,3-dioxygenase-like lactoylglutathione lyase family enzyme